jgi:hypothetical protein
MMTLERNVGRLCEARFTPPISAADVASFAGEVKALLAASTKPQIFCTDSSRVLVYPPEITDGLVALMKADNSLVERNAILIGTSSVFGLQMERMLRNAGHPGRRAFQSHDFLVAWLGEVLTAPERERLGAMLAQR